MPLNRLLGIDLPLGIQELAKECRNWPHFIPDVVG